MSCGGDCPSLLRSFKRAKLKESEDEPLTIFNIAWEDILFIDVLPHLSWEELFHLRAVNKQCMAMMAAYFDQLKRIDLSEVGEKFTANAFRVVIAQCTNLRELKIHNAPWLKDEDLSPVFQRNKKMEALDLMSCAQLKGTCLLALAVNCKNLTTLILRECNWMSAGAMDTIITHLNKLEVVDLSSCMGLTNQMMLPFIQKFRTIKVLRLANVQAVNDFTMYIIARYIGTALKILDIRGCASVENIGVKLVANLCTNLEALYIDGCTLVNGCALSVVREKGIRVDVENAPGRMMHFVIPLPMQMQQ